MKETKDLAQGSISSQIVRLALPILGTSFLQMTYSFVDMAWLGRLGSKEVAAASAASVFVWLANSIALFNKVGAETTVGYEIGRKDLSAAASYASHTTTLALLMGSAMLLIYYIFAPSLIGFYKMDADISSYGVDYMHIVAFSGPFLFLGMALTGIYNASGHSEIPFYITALGVLLNLALDPLFIFILDLGVAGAAYATLLSQIIGVVLLVRQLARDKLFGGFPYLLRQLDRAKTRILFRVGGMVSLMNALFSLISMSLGRFASLAGGHIGVTAMSIGGQLEGVSVHTAEGFSTALSAFVAQNYGSKQYDRIRAGLRFAIRFALVTGTVAMGLFYFFGTDIFGLIVPDETTAREGGNYLRINALSEVFIMIEITLQGFFYGLQRAIPPSLISIVGNIVRIPLAYLFLMLFPGLSTLWWVLLATAILKGITSGSYYLINKKKLLPQ